MAYRFSQRSLNKLRNVHPALVAICWRALDNSPHDFGITEGVRSLERQAELVSEGASMTMNSRHLTGHAIDFAVYAPKLTWEFEKYEQVANAFKDAAAHYGVNITWGGDWRTFKDGPHIELNPDEWPWEVD